MTDWILIEKAVQIAWDYLERSDEIGDPAGTAKFLTDTIARMVLKGERRQLMLTNKAIDSHRKLRRERQIELVSG